MDPQDRINNKQILNINALPIKKLPYFIFAGVSIGYHIHNLYEQYQYNKLLETQFKVEINNKETIVNASPQYFDLCTLINLSGAVSMLLPMTGSAFKLQEVLEVSAVIGCITGVISSLVSFNNEYNLTDERGHPISHDLLLSNLEI